MKQKVTDTYITEDYSLFDQHKFNRDVEKIKDLYASMKKHGYLSAYPIYAIKNGGDKLLVVDGHHRLTVAKMLDLPVRYSIDKEVPLTELIKTVKPWSIRDYLSSYVRQGIQSYIKVKEYIDRTGISVFAAMSMLGGHSAGSHNFLETFKNGLFTIGNTTNADIVADIVLWCKKIKSPVSTDVSFVKALSKIAWVESFDHEILKIKLKKHKAMIEKKPNIQDYQVMIEEIYNKGNKGKLPLSFMADEKARERNAAIASKKASK